MGNLSLRRRRAATLNFWRGVPWGKAAIAKFLAENLPRWEGSYHQFLERRALGKAAIADFFGREFAEGGGQLSLILGEACPRGGQLSPIFGQRSCRACRLRRKASKGSKEAKSIENLSKKVPKSFKNGTSERLGSPPRATLKKEPIPSTN